MTYRERREYSVIDPSTKATIAGPFVSGDTPAPKTRRGKRASDWAGFALAAAIEARHAHRGPAMIVLMFHGCMWRALFNGDRLTGWRKIV